jgi:uncharacterized protein YecE (DUF72 family)
MDIRVGTSGYAYREWKGSFYPNDLSSDRMLEYYASQFGSVEINNTFYRMPTEKVLRQWAGHVPGGFRFMLKASQRITHHRRLNAAEEPLAYLLDVSRTLGHRLGALLFQLPPNLKKDLPRLAAFLELLPTDVPAAFEFRHASWYTDDVYDTLRSHDTALCIAHSEGDVPRVATAPFGYLRLRGDSYAESHLREWAQWVTDQEWSQAFVFFKHEDGGAGPALARRFLALTGTG